MTTRFRTATIVSLALLIATWAAVRVPLIAQVDGNDNNIAIMDDCLPGDPGWNPTGGCTLKPHEGDVSFAEFGALIGSPLSSGLVGHPSWRNEPSHVTASQGRMVRVTNSGGRSHTFTEVANFGGGTIAGFNIGLTRAPECPANPADLGPLVVPPGSAITLNGLAAGLHRFQCCIHPWMHATIRVQ
jgi:plastocyanin